MILADTNVFFGFLLAKDPLHEKAKVLLAQYNTDDVYILPEVWQELITITAIRHGSERAIEFSKKIQTMFTASTLTCL